MTDSDKKKQDKGFFPSKLGYKIRARKLDVIIIEKKVCKITDCAAAYDNGMEQKERRNRQVSRNPQKTRRRGTQKSK